MESCGARKQPRCPSGPGACLITVLLAGCVSVAEEAGDPTPQGRWLPRRGASQALVLPAQPGKGLAIKVVCQSPQSSTCRVSTNVDAAHTQGQLLNAADALKAVNAPQPALPPVSAQVFSWVFDRPVDWTDLQPATLGVFDTNLDSAQLFAGATQNLAWTFAGYVAIPASGFKTFAVGSEDGYVLAVGNGTTTQISQFNGSRTFAYGDTLGLPVSVSFPAAGLYPIYLLFWNDTAPGGVELSWHDGNALLTIPDAAAKNANGYTLVPSTSLYAPDVRATLLVEDQTRPAGPVLSGDTLQWTSTVRNQGDVPASGASFTVSVPSALLQNLTQTAGAGTCGKSSDGGVETLSCPLSNLDQGAAQTLRFSAQVKSGLDAGTPIDVQGVLTGLATDPALIASVQSALSATVGNPSDLFVLTDDPNANDLANVDTGNAPVAALGASGAADDDPMRVAAGVALLLPTVPRFTSPAQGAEVEGPLPVAGSADPGSYLSLTVDGVLAAQLSAAADGAFSLSLPLSVPAGRHTLEATASDNAGNISPPADVDFDYVAGGRARGGCASSTRAGSACLVLLLWICVLRKRRSVAASFVVGSAMLAAATGANAAAPEVNLTLFRPATGGDGYAGVEGARPLAEGDGLEVRFWLDGASRMLVYLPGAGGEETVLRNRVGGWFVAQAHVWRALSLAVELPATLNQSGDLTNLPPSSRGPASTPAGLGDLRISPRLSLLRQEGAGIDLAAQMSVELPTARSQSFTGDGRVSGEALLAIGHRWDGPGVSVIELLGNAYARLRPPRQVIEVKTGNEAGARLGVGFFPGLQTRFAPHRLYAELEAQSFLRAGGNGGATPAEWRGGVGFCLGRGISFDLAGGGAIGGGIGAPLARFITAVGLSPQSCAARAPTSMSDRDGDGVADAVDQCPDQPGPAENKGCPLLVAAAPPAPPPPAAVVAPQAQEPPKVAAAPAKPPEADRDRDGVPDRDDSCPDLPGPASNYGCPVTIRQLVVIRNEKIEILDRVYFQTGKARLQRRSFPLLDQVAFLLKGHAELQTVQVEGHTDNTGAAASNLALSQARAEAVVAHLAKKGVERSRLRARGFGSAKPVADNAARAGREKNRRVEFTVLEYVHEPISQDN